MTLRALRLASATGALLAALGCAGNESGHDLAAGWRGLLGIRGARLGEPVDLPRAPFADAAFRGRIASPKLAEASGLTHSQLRSDLLWSINDSGRTPRLYALGIDGSDRGFVLVEDATEDDWEALAGFEWEGRPYLIVADTGDNLSWRRRAALLVIEEPVLHGERFPKDARVPVAWRIPFRFEDGPRDCEAVAFDAEGGRVVLVSKRTEPPAVYELPLRLPPATANGEIAVAKRVGEIPGIPPPTVEDVAESRWLGRYWSMPTGLDLSDDGRLAAVVTYKDGYLFRRAAGESWAAAFARTPERIPLPPMRQAEAITFERGGRGLYVTSERRPTPLYHLEWQERGLTPPGRSRSSR